ncbi:hypothetical protein PISMIDRAFT_18478 [Pisolithus microcarpus 441]|uniref:Uncharacterized protein n=1 Tax=Pisolithus microcarpus 441 TaxID=765257 RepID=A0A0C9YQY3_9AGAM|nr:hypothetical protein PISMIDRAFT_18478 [Pisolithus microcarpus 441]
MCLPKAEDSLQTVLGNCYITNKWAPILKIVMDAEDDTPTALEGLNKVMNHIFGCQITQIQNSTIWTQTSTAAAQPTLPQLSEAEQDLTKAVEDLKQHKWIIGMALTLEEMLNPVEEKEIGKSMYQFEGGEDDIVEQVNHGIAIKEGEIAEVESDDGAGDEADTGAEMGLGDKIHLCKQMEKVCITHGTGESSLDLSQHL